MYRFDNIEPITLPLMEIREQTSEALFPKIFDVFEYIKF